VLASFAGSVRQANSASAALMRQSSGARQLIVSLLEAYPLTSRQRALIEVEVRQDFPINTLPNCVALVLSSILSNALRALAAHSTPQLRFCVQGGAAPRILIIDNGPGIDPAILERLLVDPVTMHADSGGHGWGMIFCQRIMQSFGGRIEVQSEPGCSTSVTLNFPEMKKERA
jgi:two-component system response regulator PhcR